MVDLGGVGVVEVLGVGEAEAEEGLEVLFTDFWGMIGATWAVVGRGGPTAGREPGEPWEAAGGVGDAGLGAAALANGE